MTWLSSLLIVALLIVVLWKLLGWQPLAKNQTRRDFEHWVSCLLTLKENGGILRIAQRKGPVFIEFVRESGDDDSATLAMKIPRRRWSEEKKQEICNTLGSQCFDIHRPEDEEEILLQVRIPVTDIWEECAGAKGAHAARLVMDTLEVEKDARFDCPLFGYPSKRELRREQRLRREGGG